MSFLISVALVVAAAILVGLGAFLSSTPLYVAAACASAVAVFLLWRRAASEREYIFLTDPPQRSEPNWQRDRSGVQYQGPDDETDGPDRLEDARSLGIANYDDLLTSEIMPSLETLSIEQLRAVIAREQRGLRREAVIERARRLIELTGGLEREQEINGPSLTGPGRGKRTRKSLQKDGPELSL